MYWGVFDPAKGWVEKPRKTQTRQEMALTTKSILTTLRSTAKSDLFVIKTKLVRHSKFYRMK